ncbi:MAG: DUF4198 domain-containing protein [bacterium]
MVSPFDVGAIMISARRPAVRALPLLALPLLTLLALLPASSGWAHDFWIEPGRFRPPVGEPVVVTLRVGQNFAGNSVPNIPAWFSDFRTVGPDGKSKKITGAMGDDPAGSFTPRRPGLHIVGYRSTPHFVEVAPKLFGKYLVEEGLEFIAARRAAAGGAGASGRELFSRCSKALLWAGGGAAPANGQGGHDLLLGYTLELVPELNPYALAPGASLPVRLLFNGAPLPAALVVAFTRANPSQRVRARTDLRGRVVLKLPRAGVWLVKAVHMVDAPPNTEARWESFWAALTFELPPG